MIRPATINDLNNIMKIILPTIAIMNQEGNTQWDHEYPLATDFLQDINSGHLFVFANAADIQGVICINNIEPSEYGDVNWKSGKTASVIHRMAIAPSSRKQGIGSALMAFAETIAQKTGTYYLKTDTYSSNNNMNGLFQKFGYQPVGKIRFRNRPHPFICYEKSL